MKTATKTPTKAGLRLLITAALGGVFILPHADAKPKKPTSPSELRSDYIQRLQEQDAPKAEHTVGSLWNLGDTSATGQHSSHPHQGRSDGLKGIAGVLTPSIRQNL